MATTRGDSKVALTGGLLALIGFIGVLGPFGSDIYLPALPKMAIDLQTNVVGIQSSLMAFSIGMAVGQLVLSSASDKYGRRPILVLGIAFMFASSLVAGLAVSLAILVVACCVMGMSAAAIQTMGRAIVSDLAHGKDAAKAFSLIGFVTSVGPIAAPLLGTLAMIIGGWRGIFIDMAGFSALLLVLGFMRIPETLGIAQRHSGGLKQFWSNAASIIKNKHFLTHATMIWCAFGILFSYISASPFVLQKIYHLSPAAYSLDFAANGVGMMVTSYLSAWLTHRISLVRQIGVGLALFIFATVTLVLALALHPDNPTLVFVAFAFVPASLSFIFGPVFALGLRDVRHMAGTAIAIQGSIQFAIAGAASVLVGLAGQYSIMPLTMVWLVLSAVAMASYRIIIRDQKTS